jgi:hypothetical protein
MLQVLDLEFSCDHSWSTCMLNIFQTVSPLFKKFVPLKHSTKTQGAFTICLPDHLKHLPRGFPNSWQNLMFSHCSICNILDFHCSQTIYLQNSNFLPELNCHTSHSHLISSSSWVKKICTVVHLLHQNLHSWSQIISSICGLNLEGRIMDTILLTVDSSRITRKLLHCKFVY